MKKKKGFILYYTIVSMLLIVSLITFMMTLVVASAKNNKKLLKSLDDRYLMDQYAEYFIADRNHVFEENDNYDVITDGNVLTVRLKGAETVKLYVELDESGKVVRKLYGEYKAGE